MTAQSDKATNGASVGRRALRWGVGVALGLVVLLFAAPVLVWAWLVSSSGEAFVREKIERAVNDEFAGRIEIGRLELSGFLTLVASDVKLYAPDESLPVLAFDRLAVDADVGALLSRHISLGRVALDGPVVRLVQSEHGLNLSRALSSKSPKPPSGPSSSSGNWVLRAPDVRVRSGTASMEGAGVAVRTTALSLRGEAEGSLSALVVDATLGASLEEPLAAQVAVRTSLVVRDDALDVRDLDLTAGDSALQAKGRLRYDLSSLQLALEHLSVSPAELNPFLPEPRLEGAIAAKGMAVLDEGAARAAFEFDLPKGRATIDATAHIDWAATPVLGRWDAVLELDDIQPNALWNGLPELNVGGSVRLSEGEGIPGEGKVKVAVTGRRLRYESLPIQLFSFRGALDGQRVQAETLTVQAAGVELVVSGVASMTDARLVGHIDAPSFAHTRRTLATGLGLSLPEMQGRARVDARVDGPWSAPLVRVTGEVPAYTSEAFALTKATIDVDVERWTPELRLKADVKTATLRFGEVEGSGLSLAGRMDGARVQGTIDGELADTRVVARIDARRLDRAPHDGERWRLDELRASALGVEMSAEKRTFVDLEKGRTAIAPVTLSGDLGRFTFEGHRRASGALAATLDIDALHLARVPALLLPDGLVVEGELRGRASFAGTLETPKADALLTLSNARVDDLRGIGLRLDGKLDAGRVVMTLDADVGEDAHASFAADLPVESPARVVKKPAPVTASLTLDHLSPRLIRAFSKDFPLEEGRIEGAVTLTGLANDPTFNARLSIVQARGLGVDAVDASVEARWAKGEATLEGLAMRGQSLDVSVVANAPLPLEPLVNGTLPDWRRLAVKGEVRLTHLALGWLERLGYVPVGTRGTAAGRVRVSGTAHSPELASTIAVRGLWMEGLRDVDLTLDTRLNENLDATLSAQLGSEPLLEVSAQAQVGGAGLVALRPGEQWKVPLAVTAKVLPTELSRFLGNDQGSVNGRASLTMTLTGTGEAPRLSLKGLVDEVRMGEEGQALGQLVLDGGYDGRQTRLSARFDSEKAGTLVALATLPGALSVESFETPEALDAVLARRADVSLTTSDFDLALLNGLTPDVRDIGGRVTLRVKKVGPLLEPGGEGTLLVKQARAALLDYGEINDTGLDLAFAWPAFELRRLSGKSGTGVFDIRGQVGSTDGGRSFNGSLKAELDKVPLVQHFETKGWLSLLVDAKLEFRDRLLMINPLLLSKGLLKIADSSLTRQLTGQGKDVQSLERNPDIVYSTELRAKRKREERAARRAAEGKHEDPLRTEVRLSIPNDFVIDAPMGNRLTLGAALKITHDPSRQARDLDPLDVEGRVNVIKGTINVLRRFDVTKGQLTFKQGQWKEPELDIEAKHEGNDGTVVTVALGGTTTHMTKRFQLTPPGGESPTNDEAEVLFYLTTGRRQAQANTVSPDLNEALATAGMNAIGALGVSGVKWIAQHVLPLPDSIMPDVLSVDTDLRNGIAGSIGRVRAGKYISDRIYIGAQYNREANVEQGESLFEVEGSYRLSEHSSLKLHGAEGRFGGEITYQKDLPTKAQRKASERR